MKELSIEQKAKRYDEAKYIMKEYLESGNAGVIAENTIKKAFPELAESEDERIRKAMINGFNKLDKSAVWYNGITNGQILAWLEKQGDLGEMIKNLKPVNEVLEQKPIVIIPKFRIGDNIKTVNEEPLTITKIDEKGYWSKDLFICGFDEECIWDLVGQKHADKIEPKFKVKYAGSEYNVLEVKDIAGVTFYGIEDEPNHIDYVQAENCERVRGYSIKEKGSPYPTKPAVFSKQKSTWSEEDDEHLERILKELESQRQRPSNRPYLDEIESDYNWLKSLKNRVQLKQEYVEQQVKYRKL